MKKNKIIWKDIEVADIAPMYKINNFGQVKNKKTGYILDWQDGNKGYKRVFLKTKNGDSKYYSVHRLVMLVFDPIENPDQYQVNHKNLKKDHNYYHNLEWCTNVENMKHAMDNGAFAHISNKGEDNNFSKYSEKQIRKVCKLLAEGVHNKDIEKETGVDRSTIFVIYYKKRWLHISENYIFPEVIRLPKQLSSNIKRKINKGWSNKKIINHYDELDDNPSVHLYLNTKRYRSR